MKAITWFVAGRIAIEIWLALNPAERTELIGTAAQVYCDRFQCRKTLVKAEQTDKEIIILTQCYQWEV